MKKLLLKTMLLLFALIAGTSMSWAEDYTYTFTSKQFSSNSTVSLSGVSWTLAGDGGYWGYDGTKGQQFGSGSNPYKSLSLSTSGISGTITSIVVNASTASSATATISCTVGGAAFGTQSQSLSATATNYTFSGSASGEIVVSMSQSTSKALYVKSITVTYSTTYTVTYDANGATGGSVPTDDTEYSSGDDVTVLGQGSLVNAGYTFGGWNTADDGSGDTYDEDDTFTITANTTLYAVWNAKTITDLTKTGEPAKTSYKVGDSFDPTGLTVKATFNDASEETVTGSVVWTPDPLTAGATSVTGTYMGLTVNVTGLTVTKNDAVIVVADDNVAYGSTFTVDASVIEGGDITVTSSNANVATVAGLVITPVAVGTTTITVATAENATYNEGYETFTLTVTAPTGKSTALYSGFAQITSASDLTDGDYLIVYETGNVAFNGGADDSGIDVANNTIDVTITDHKIAKSSETEAAVFTWNSAEMTLQSASGLYIGKTATGNGMDKSGSTKYTNTISFGSRNVIITAAGGSVLKYNKNNDQKRFRYYGSGQQDIQLYKKGEPITATLNGSGYATFCSQYPLDFSDYETADYSAWQVTGVSGSTITFEQVTGSVKGGTGLLLMGTENATITLTSADSDETLSGNLLVGTLAPTYVANGDYYGLKANEFIQVNAGTVPAGKALLPVPGGSGVKAFTFVFEDATGIESIQNSKSEIQNAIFDLSGRRVVKPTKGLYIVNGKKIVK